MRAPMLYHIWVTGTALALPFALRAERRKLADAGADPARLAEKRGQASAPRPDGPLIWFHAASVGESLSVRALITRMGALRPKAHFLLTTGTATSAQLLATRLPPRTLHQFAPLDAPGPLRRFLNHWRPDAAFFVESELWPQMLRRTKGRGLPMALINARLSERSLARWAARPRLTQFLLGVFDVILTQNRPMARALEDLGLPPERIRAGVNLKSFSDPLPVDAQALAATRAALGARPVWVAASTHAGEEETVLAAHQILRQRWPDLCLILAPRHPERSDEVHTLITAAGLKATRRSRDETPEGDVYLADTLGELGQWYALSDVVFLGGSLKPIGGHNPFEVAQASAFALSGPHVTNFAETFAEMEAAGAARIVGDAQGLARDVAALLGDPAKLSRARAAAAGFATARGDVLTQIAQDLLQEMALS